MKYNIMRVIIFSFLFGFSFISLMAENVQTGTGETDGYKLVWQDLFDGDELNETDNWSVEINGDGCGNREIQYYRKENISIGNEPVTGSRCLIITAKKENFLGSPATSGRLTTQGKMFFKHGKLEARIKLPHTADGLWPAFWMLGNTISNEGWPRCGEVDILEMGHSTGIRNNTQDRLFNGACHWGYYENGGYPNYAKATTNSYGMQDDFHLFTMIWNENVIQMFLDKDIYPDAKPYYEMNISANANPQDPGNYFHRPFFVIFNLAVGGNFLGIWDINGITALKDGEAKMYVDYVKLYQKGESHEEFTGVGVPPTFVNSPSHDQQIKVEILGRKINIKGEVERLTMFSVDGTTELDKCDSNIIEATHLQAGMYIIKVNMKDGTSFSRKIYLQ